MTTTNTKKKVTVNREILKMIAATLDNLADDPNFATNLEMTPEEILHNIAKSLRCMTTDDLS